MRYVVVVVSSHGPMALATEIEKAIAEHPPGRLRQMSTTHDAGGAGGQFWWAHLLFVEP